MGHDKKYKESIYLPTGNLIFKLDAIQEELIKVW